jgi:hypothetical protein
MRRNMHTRIIRAGDLSPAEEHAWCDLAGRAIEPNPFFEPGFLALAGRYFDGFAKTRLLIAQEGSAFKGLLPIVGVERARIPPRPTMTTRGNPTMISGACTPLVDRTCVDEAVGALLDGLQDGAKRGDVPGIMSLKRLGDDGPVAHSLRRQSGARGLPVHTKESYERGMVNRDGRWENPLSGSRRREIARRRRLLAREAGQEVHMVDRSQHPEAATDFLMIEASGWKGRDDGTAYARDPQKVAWFYEWCDYWRASGRLTVLALHLGDTPIAMQYFIRSGDGLFLYRIAYDERFPKYGLGQMLLESAMAWLFQETDALWLDACTDPNNEFLLAMLPERRTTSMVLIGTGGMVDRTFVSATPTMSRAVVAQRRVRKRLVRSGHSPSNSKKH